MLKQTYCPEFQTVQCAFKDSMIHGSAIHTTFRVLLRSSSLREPRDPLPKVVFNCTWYLVQTWVRYNGCVKAVGFSLANKFASKTGPTRDLESAQVGYYTAWRRNQRRRPVHCCSTVPPRGEPRPNANTVMILPQVHLRKPCYDFYFL